MLRQISDRERERGRDQRERREGRQGEKESRRWSNSAASSSTGKVDNKALRKSLQVAGGCPGILQGQQARDCRGLGSQVLWLLYTHILAARIARQRCELNICFCFTCLHWRDPKAKTTRRDVVESVAQHVYILYSPHLPAATCYFLILRAAAPGAGICQGDLTFDRRLPLRLNFNLNSISSCYLAINWVALVCCQCNQIILCASSSTRNFYLIRNAKNLRELFTLQAGADCCLGN